MRLLSEPMAAWATLRVFSACGWLFRPAWGCGLWFDCRARVPPLENLSIAPLTGCQLFVLTRISGPPSVLTVNFGFEV